MYLLRADTHLEEADFIERQTELSTDISLTRDSSSIRRVDTEVFCIFSEISGRQL